MNNIPSLSYLIDLHRSHIRSIPFEALDVNFKNPISLDLKDISTKVITGNRGGYCYELNYLFHSLLLELGFHSKMISASVFHEGKFGPAYDHLAILVSLEADWLVDVGFGNSFIEPIKLELGLIQEDQFKEYRIEAEDSGLHILLESAKGQDSFENMYSFDLKPRNIDEFEDQNHFKQYSPDSHFTKKRICTIATENGRKTVYNDVFKRLVGETLVEEPIENDEALFQLLQSEFGIVLKKR